MVRILSSNRLSIANFVAVFRCLFNSYIPKAHTAHLVHTAFDTLTELHISTRILRIYTSMLLHTHSLLRIYTLMLLHTCRPNVAPQPNMRIPPLQVLAVAKENSEKLRFK